MPRNAFNFGYGLGSVKNPIGSGLGSQKSSKRTLGIRDKQILYHRAKGKCEACGKKIEFSEMLTGHKTAASKGGSTTFRNSVCLCYKCNKLQGTDSWATFMKKRGKSNTRSVTSGKKRSPPKKKSKGKSSSGNYWINPITGKKETQPLFRL